MTQSLQSTNIEIWDQLRSFANTCWSTVCAKVSDTKNFAGILTTVDEQARLAAIQTQRRNETIAKLLSTLLGLGLSLGVTYLGVRYIMKAMDPTHNERAASIKRAELLMQKIGVKGVQLTDYELCIASNLVDPLSIVADWKDIGGLEDIIQDIQDNLILPFRHRNLFFGSALVQPPKGVLLYGPPGCGKTMIAKATAKATGARFINLQVSSLFDKWYGESQKRAEAVFSLAYKIQPTIIFIDEIDSFLRVRNAQDQETTAMVKTQFMSFWDGLLTDPNCQIMIMGATNRPNDIDAAILRRLPLMYHIKLPSERERRSILNVILSKEQLDDSVSVPELASRTDGFSGSDLKELCRSAAICRVNEFLRSETTRDETAANDTFEEAHELRSINMSDFNLALKKWQRSKLQVITELQSIDVD